MSKKELVIEKARTLFQEYGYKKVSMDEVAKEANVTKKTIYTYFKDKEDLFKYFIEEELQHMKEESEKTDKENLPFIEKVSKTIYNLLSYRRNSLLFKNILKEKDTINNNFLKLYDEEILNYIESKLKNEIELGSIKECDPTLTAFIIYHVYLAVMFEYDKELNEKEVTEQITSILKNGLLN